MRRERSGLEDSRAKGVEPESAHALHRRIKQEQERLLRKELSRLRAERLDDEEPGSEAS